MTRVLAVLAGSGGAVDPASFEAVAAGLGLKEATAGSLAVAHLGPDSGRAGDVDGLQGVDEMIEVSVATAHLDAVAARAALEAAIARSSAEVVLMISTLDAQSFAAGVAARLGYGLVADATGIAWESGSLVVEREFAGGSLIGAIEYPPGSRAIVLLRPGAVEASRPRSGTPPAPTAVSVAAPPRGARLVAREERARTDDVDISKADLIVAIGRGIEDEDDIEEFEQLAMRLGATLCASRPLVDAGLMPASRQVGQSGASVAPKVYLAFGISGAPQHLAGIRDAGTVIAVNTDSNAPIFSVADYGVVADAFDVAEALAELRE